MLIWLVLFKFSGERLHIFVYVAPNAGTRTQRRTQTTEMELWMERVPESIKKAVKREAEMLASERAAIQQEELVRIILSKYLCQNVENIFL